MNRLQYETSPYLLQHKDNPVDWYPWGDEAFEVARSEDKPILLSVGYSACHWCHVMAHESFEHGPTASIMNQFFVNIKVDREERPDVDDIYMQAVLAMNRGQGGWPMTVFLLPDGKPFFGGTYFPVEARHGMPSFRQILHAVYDAYINRRADLDEQAQGLTEMLDRSSLNIQGSESDFTPDLLKAAMSNLLRQVDRTHGGFGSQPKFPNPMNLAYLLRSHARTGDDEALLATSFSLRKMAQGGIYDQLGGGFHRYSVDNVWLVPHFEKMLYDNAQLSRLYLHAWQVTRDPYFRRIAEDIYDYILREMTAPEGGFYSTTDADSEGEEGRFFVWTLDQVREALAPIADDVPDAVAIAESYWGMLPGGNFEGSNILNVPEADSTIAEQFGITSVELQERLLLIRDRLYAARTQRVAPSLDDKILTAWNGMMLASLAEAARVLGRDDYLVAAERCGEFMLEKLVDERGRLYRSYKDGDSRLNGYLEDYANLIDALLELYQSTFVDRWFHEARRLADIVLAHFSAQDGGFFDTSDDHETLIVRPRSLQDNAVPSGNSMMARQLVRLAAYTGHAPYETAARQTLTLMSAAMREYPQAFGEALNAVDMLVNGLSEVAIVGNPAAPETREILRSLREPYRPNVIVALVRESVEGEHRIPLLSYRSQREGQPTVYVCRNFACAFPVTSAEEMEKLLTSPA